MPPQEYGLIKEYNLKKVKFKTVKIPKGTLLFRGLHFGSERHTSSLFNDFVGYTSDGRYSVSPTMNVFFYPAPYVSDSVSTFNIYSMYITQYDLELILLVNPAIIDRRDARDLDEPLTICNKISKYDKCGFEMSDIDPCITESVLKKYPYINGYIAISHTDATILFGKYKKLIADGEYEKAKHILPTILMNSGGLISTPEIVIHPFYHRHDECYTYGKNLRTAEQFVRYCIENRAQYNYFPLLYITNKDIYTFTDLMNIDIVRAIKLTERIYNAVKPPLHDKIEYILHSMLHNGYIINGEKYYAYIDQRTGFYTLLNKKVSYTRKNRNNIYSNNNVTYIVNSSKYFDDMLDGLNKAGYSVKKEYVFNKGHIPDFITKFYINEVINRPDLEVYRNKRRRNRNATMKNIRNRFADIDLDNISSVESGP